MADENDDAYREQAEATIADLRARLSHYEALLVHAREQALTEASDRDFGVCACGRALLSHKGEGRWWHAYGGGIDHLAEPRVAMSLPPGEPSGDRP